MTLVRKGITSGRTNMFEHKFNFENSEQETISDEIRKLLEDTGIHPTAEDFDFLGLWKDQILSLSGNN